MKGFLIGISLLFQLIGILGIFLPFSIWLELDWFIS